MTAQRSAAQRELPQAVPRRTLIAGIFFGSRRGGAMGPASRVGPSGSGEAARKLLSKSTVAVTAVAVTVRVAAAVTVRVAAAVTVRVAAAVTVRVAAAVRVAVRVATVEWIKTSLTLWCAPR